MRFFCVFRFQKFFPSNRWKFLTSTMQWKIMWTACNTCSRNELVVIDWCRIAKDWKCSIYTKNSLFLQYSVSSHINDQSSLRTTKRSHPLNYYWWTLMAYSHHSDWDRKTHSNGKKNSESVHMNTQLAIIYSCCKWEHEALNTNTMAH